MRKVRWGILGTARIASKAFLPGLQNASNGEMVGIAGRSKDKVRQFAQQFPALTPYSSYDELLCDHQIEAVYIPLPNSMHLEWTLKALEHGKAVLCEKPLALHSEEIKLIQKASREHNKPVMEAFAYRHNPLIHEIKKAIDSKEIGDLRQMVSVFTFPLINRPDDIRFSPELGGGATYDVGCYPIHLMRTLTSQEPLNVHSRGVIKSGVDLSASVMLDFPQSVSGFFHCGFDQPFRMVCEVSGTEGILSTEVPFNQQGRLNYRIRKNNEGWEERWVESLSNYQLEAEQFGRVLLDMEAQLISLEDSYHNARVIDRVLQGIH